MAVKASIRRATAEDVPAIVSLLADDALGEKREDPSDPLPMSYFEAFFAIDGDRNHQLVVAEIEGRVVGTLQLSFLPYLTYRGGTRAQIEGVRVAQEARGTGLGRQLVEWAVERAKNAGCHMAQLTTDRQRPDAHSFYEQLGFEATHLGFKLHF